MASRVDGRTAGGSLNLRAEAEADAPFLFRLFAGGRASDMAAMPVGAAEKDFLLRTQFRSMTASYRQRFPRARFEIIDLDGVPVGRLVTDVRSDCVYYADIALMPAYRRNGLATAVMRTALDEPRRLGLPGRVKVLSSNSASLRLCHRLGMRARLEAPPMVELEWNAPAGPKTVGFAPVRS